MLHREVTEVFEVNVQEVGVCSDSPFEYCRRVHSLTDVAAGEQSARAERLRELQQEDNVPLDVENEDQIEKIVSPTPSTLESVSRKSSQDNGDNGLTGIPSANSHAQRIIRFEDGDPENPDNWGRVGPNLHSGLCSS